MNIGKLAGLALATSLLAGMSVAVADWRNIGGGFIKGLGDDSSKGSSTPSAPTAAVLDNNEVVAGLKEALVKGSEIVVGELGRKDGFLENPGVRIPLPDALDSVGSGMRTFGMGNYVDAFEISLNRAAEEAVPEALDLLVETVREMSVEDAKAILYGPDDAATQYFRKQNEGRLAERFLPIVSKATDSVGVTGYYKQMLGKAGMAAQFFDPESLDIDKYVTGEAIDSMFELLAREEKSIRDNPLARSTDLLKKVFGNL